MSSEQTPASIPDTTSVPTTSDIVSDIATTTHTAPAFVHPSTHTVQVRPYSVASVSITTQATAFQQPAPRTPRDPDTVAAATATPRPKSTTRSTNCRSAYCSIDRQLQIDKQAMAYEFNTAYNQHPEHFCSLLADTEWPTPEVCQDLQLDLALVTFVPNALSLTTNNINEKTNQQIQEMRQHIVEPGASIFKSIFLMHFGGGTQPSINALADLKKLRQNTTPMSKFASEITELIIPAEIYSDSLQLDLFCDRVHPKLQEAIYMRGATTLQEAIEICNRVEYNLSRAGLKL
ncbi:hypothetical protein BDC45DRAFT_565803 [Circinella umbellata]|nr:hypothetical protein BDC45DRAFT_565803 [Circinella umbellata]